MARARAQVLAGRGPGAPPAETERHQRERPTLGPLPSPLERELVHLNTAAFRQGAASDVDATTVRNQRERVRALWGWPPPHAAAESPPRSRLAACVGFAAGAVIAMTVSRLRRRYR